MINANELRVGNWVNVVHGNVQIEKFVTGGVHFTNGNGGNFQSLSPIPLTPKILEKAGFEFKKKVLVNKKTNSIYYEYYWLDKICIKKDPDNNWMVGYININELQSEFSIESYIPVHPLSVHQLQNLYFALTGEELVVESFKFYPIP